MRLLLDTHVVLWTLDDLPRLWRRARELMAARGAECFFSAVSFWEIAIKAGLRRKDCVQRLKLPTRLDLMENIVRL